MITMFLKCLQRFRKKYGTESEVKRCVDLLIEKAIQKNSLIAPLMENFKEILQRESGAYDALVSANAVRGGKKRKAKKRKGGRKTKKRKGGHKSKKVGGRKSKRKGNRKTRSK